MNEFELIAKIARNLPANNYLVKGVGDDCAVLDLGISEQLFLFKTDAVVQDVHFTLSTPPAKVGRKALARALSDIAAMAGAPIAALVTLGLPRPFEPRFVVDFYEGLNALAREFSVSVAGGETTHAPGLIFASISLIGSIPRHRRLSRGAAQPGDAIFVSGELGGSLSGWHLDFIPRIREAQWLAENFPVHAMMDLSDGLAGDLRHILQESNVGAEIHSRAVPISRAARTKSRTESSSKPPLLAALTDGEDFELLFTVPAKHAVALLDGWRNRFPETKMSCVGRITAEPGLRIRDKEGVRQLAAHGFTHFQKS